MAKKEGQVVVMHRGLWFIGLEFIAIVFGVFLGGFLAERRGERDLEDLIARSREAIQAEMVTNYNELLTARAYHLEQFASSVEVVQGRLDPQSFYEGMTRGFSLPQIQTGAYDAAIAAGLVVYFDAAEFAQISRAYSVAQLSNGSEQAYIQALVTSDSQDPTRPVMIMNSAFRQFLTADDAGVQVLAPLVGEEAPDYWSVEYRQLMQERAKAAAE